MMDQATAELFARLQQQVTDLDARLAAQSAEVNDFAGQTSAIGMKGNLHRFSSYGGEGGGTNVADYDAGTGTYGTLTYNKPIHMVWWDGDYSTSGAYEELLKAAGTTYTGEGTYLVVKLDMTEAYGSRWSVARYTTNKVADSDPDVALYWCLGQIVDNEFVEWTFVIEHMGS